MIDVVPAAGICDGMRPEPLAIGHGSLISGTADPPLLGVVSWMPLHLRNVAD